MYDDNDSGYLRAQGVREGGWWTDMSFEIEKPDIWEDPVYVILFPGRGYPGQPWLSLDLQYQNLRFMTKPENPIYPFWCDVSSKDFVKEDSGYSHKMDCFSVGTKPDHPGLSFAKPHPGSIQRTPSTSYGFNASDDLLSLSQE